MHAVQVATLTLAAVFSVCVAEGDLKAHSWKESFLKHGFLISNRFLSLNFLGKNGRGNNKQKNMSLG